MIYVYFPARKVSVLLIDYLNTPCVPIFYLRPFIALYVSLQGVFKSLTILPQESPRFSCEALCQVSSDEVKYYSSTEMIDAWGHILQGVISLELLNRAIILELRETPPRP